MVARHPRPRMHQIIPPLFLPLFVLSVDRRLDIWRPETLEVGKLASTAPVSAYCDATIYRNSTGIGSALHHQAARS